MAANVINSEKINFTVLSNLARYSAFMCFICKTMYLLHFKLT